MKTKLLLVCAVSIAATAFTLSPLPANASPGACHYPGTNYWVAGHCKGVIAYNGRWYRVPIRCVDRLGRFLHWGRCA
jgi:hypothetical protein